MSKKIEKFIEQKWQYYFGDHIHLLEFDEGVRNELRAMFFSGATSMLEIINEMGDLSNEEMKKAQSAVRAEIQTHIAATGSVEDYQ